ncbi:phosphotransferase family protein [Actinomadura rugatobispora]|uniref:Phosphotransferase family protein n=1 Tax=Actinomadura rugatobispora TaxID=1994 RepID=A0ABW1A0H5_9ACTN|nr:phosphotransferase family protein [Actinomadura rugatobispora]
MTGSAAAAASTPLQLDATALAGWLGGRLGEPGAPLTVTRIGTATGIGNALFELRLGEDSYVLRRPPAVLNDASASNMVREWRILTALEGTPVPHPAPRLLCEDPEVIGAPFLVMDKITGFTPGFEMPEPFGSDPALRRGLAEAYVDALVDLAEVDWRARGLEGLGKPEGFLERQVPRWLAQLDRYRTRDLPELDFVTGWLERNRPAGSAPALIHGDYSPFNVMVAPAPPPRLAAVIDWDTGTIGDPLLDIGHLVARWTDPGEELVLTALPGRPDGDPTRAELVARYARRSGRDLSALPYYACLALFKLGVILEGTYAREARRGVPEEKNSMAVMVPRLMVAAARFARGERGL